MTWPVEIRQGEGGKLLLSALLAGLAVAEAVLIRTFSDARFLATFPVAWLPFFFLANALLFLPATFTYGALSRRLPRHVLHVAMLGLFAVVSLASLWALVSQALVFAVVLLLAVVSPLVNVVAWSSILGRLNSREARRLVPLVSAGATLGGIVAGLLAIPFIRLLGVDRLLLPIAGINVLLAVLVARRRRGSLESEAGGDVGGRTLSLVAPGSEGSRSATETADHSRAMPPGRRDLLANRLLMLLSAAVLLMSLSSNLAEYAFKDVLQRHYLLEVGKLAIFLAYFNSLTNILILLVQLFFVGRAVRLIGLQSAFALHPLVMLLGLLSFALFPVLPVVACWRLADGLFKFAFHGPILEMAVTPVPRGLRDRGRALLKGTMHPLGGFLAGALLLGGGLLVEETLWKVLPGVALAGGLWLYLALNLKGRYLEQLRSTLGDTRPGPVLVPSTGLSAGAAEAPIRQKGEGQGEGKGEVAAELRTRSGVIRLVDGQVRILQQAVAAGGLRGEELERALDRLFELLAALGDRATVDLVHRRYQRGDLTTKAVALELLEMHLEERRVAEAVELLETLAPELVEQAAQQRAEAQRQQDATLGSRIMAAILRR